MAAMWREGSPGPGETVLQRHVRREDGRYEESTTHGEENNTATKDTRGSIIDG